MCPDGLAWCVFETGLAVIGLLFIAGWFGILDYLLPDKEKKESK